ncbi:MAG TPA: EamA family transporter [Bacteroidales bacterium]|nr:EamA family transporter [Bacteroidales bacterium]
MKKFTVNYGAVILSMIFWSFSFIWFKVANETFRPLTIVFFRLVISVILLNAFISLTRSHIKIRKKDRKLFFLLALFEPFLYFLGESFGLTYVTATTGSVIISTIPVIATIGAWVIYRESLRAVNYAGIILSFIGILVFILNKDGSLSFDIRGILLLTFAVFSAVGYNLTLNRLVGTYDPVYIVNIQNMMGALLFLPIFLIFDVRHFINTPFSLRSFIPIVELAVFASCGAFILFAYSVRKMGVARANVFTNCIPIFTAFLSFLVLGDRMTLQNIAGIIIVVAGLFMSQINGRSGKTGEAMILTGKTA